MKVLAQIRQHAGATADLLQRCDWDGFGAAIARSWELNQRLDRGTNTPEVQAILDAVAAHLAGAKLLGAGGGGFLLMVAKNDDAARRIRTMLTERPPNSRARFVALQPSGRGFQVTRS